MPRHRDRGPLCPTYPLSISNRNDNLTRRFLKSRPRWSNITSLQWHYWKYRAINRLIVLFPRHCASSGLMLNSTVGPAVPLTKLSMIPRHSQKKCCLATAVPGIASLVPFKNSYPTGKISCCKRTFHHRCFSLNSTPQVILDLTS